MVRGARPLHLPVAVRQVATPLPWLSPNPTAIFTIDGITAMHLASLMTLSGIALSGIAVISSSTLAALSMRFSMSDLSLSSSACASPKLCPCVNQQLAQSLNPLVCYDYG